MTVDTTEDVRDAPETDEEGTEEVTPPEEPEGAEEEPETFPKEYVQKLRKEAADHRAKAKDRDDLAARLHTELVRATGRLADPSDLPFDEEHLTDADKLKEAVDELLRLKPHLASRKPSGNVGQGEGTGGSGSVNLAELLRANV